MTPCSDVFGCARRYAVAWYPVYRIPDAPLSARFLTFHNVALKEVPPPLGRAPSGRVTGQRPCCLEVTGAC